MSGRVSSGWSIQGNNLLPSIIFGTYIYFALLGWGRFKPLHDHKMEIWKEKCSSGLADFHMWHWPAVPAFCWAGGAWSGCLNLFLEGHFMTGDAQICCPPGGGSTCLGIWRCRSAAETKQAWVSSGDTQIGCMLLQREWPASLTQLPFLLLAFCLLLKKELSIDCHNVIEIR